MAEYQRMEILDIVRSRRGSNLRGKLVEVQGVTRGVGYSVGEYDDFDERLVQYSGQLDQGDSTLTFREEFYLDLGQSVSDARYRNRRQVTFFGTLRSYEPILYVHYARLGDYIPEDQE